MARNQLRPLQQMAYQKRMKTYFVKEKLMVEEAPFRYDNLEGKVFAEEDGSKVYVNALNDAMNILKNRKRNENSPLGIDVPESKRPSRLHPGHPALLTMDPETFLELANQVTKLKMFPYFDIAHSAITVLYLREDLGPRALEFSRKHPLACYVSAMLQIFAGGIIASALLGEPMLGPFKNSGQLMIATAVWYFIFYMPFDIGYKITKVLPIKVVLAAMKEIYRCKKVHDGVTHAAKIYPQGILAMIVIGTVKGNGGGFIKIIDRLVRGVWTPAAMEFLVPSFPTKACLTAATIFVLDKRTELISAPHSLVYFGIVIFFVYFKLSSLLLHIHDPFVPFENLVCMFFFGGIWDTVARLAGRKSATEETNGKMETKSDVAKKKE
ncbi:unnamed protein product [Cyprideis torosa]|uniref:Uncharacterized protein n=1 Tax=Cyprideis torosa TaxID=163714 RepID=A0A7R8W8F8_9CRUS|nr:unnamed protein product [Cyprideis torosa]CAG0888550.1 unnamed protein product [Cyprideis torosa]